MISQYRGDEIDPVFTAVCAAWRAKIVNARDHKETAFQEYANDCQAFFEGPRDWGKLMTGGALSKEGKELPLPFFQISVNKTFEFVTLFGPALYFDNPYRTARPWAPVVLPPQFFASPQEYQAAIQQENSRVAIDGLRGVLLETVLNTTQNNFNLTVETRQAIDEGLIKGRGCLWTELYDSPVTGFKSVRSVYDSVDNLFCDPDAERFEEVEWIARRRVRAAWDLEQQYGLRRGSLKGQYESNDSSALASTSASGEYDRIRGLTNDLVVYYEIWSRMGVGGRLSGFNEDWRDALEPFGDFAYLVVAEGVPFPLNLPPDVLNDPGFQADPRVVFGRTQWPLPFYACDGWPVSALDFHRRSKGTWPLAHLRAGMGELKAINWVISFLLGKVRITSRQLIALRRALKDDIKETVLNGKDLELIEVDDSNVPLDQIIQVLNFPEVNGDIWKVLQILEDNFDKRVGLNELMYGSGGATQIRSASEVQARSDNMNVRPADMAKRVFEWQSQVAAKEALAARLAVTEQDVAPLLGPVVSPFWGQFVATTDLMLAANQLEYRIEAGSTQRPNRNTQIQQITAAVQTIAPILVANAQQTGDPTAINNLLSDYAKAQELDPSRYQLAAPPLPQPPAAPGQSQPAQAQQ